MLMRRKATGKMRPSITTIIMRMTLRRIMTTITGMVTITIITTTSIAITDTTVIPMLMTTTRPDADEADGAAAASEAAALYRLMTWLSPAFPVGGFSYSSGIEWAVEAGDIGNATSLTEWLAAMLAEGSGLSDGIFLAHAHRAVETHDEVALAEVAELAAAFVSSRERQLETLAQGRAFIEIARSAWSCAGLDQAVAHCNGVIVYPVAVGLASAAHGIPLTPTLHAFLHALTSNWISAGGRLVPLGQTDCQRVLAGLESVVAATAQRAMTATLDDLGTATFRADLASLRHETQYTRLFRS